LAVLGTYIGGLHSGLFTPQQTVGEQQRHIHHTLKGKCMAQHPNSENCLKKHFFAQ